MEAVNTSMKSSTSSNLHLASDINKYNLLCAHMSDALHIKNHWGWFNNKKGGGYFDLFGDHVFVAWYKIKLFISNKLYK